MDDIPDNIQHVLENQAEQIADYTENGQWNYAVSTAKAYINIIEHERGIE